VAQQLEIPGEEQDELDAVRIRDNGEPLVDFCGLSPRLRLAPQHPVFDFPRVHLVRQSVACMLVRAAESLPAGLQLHVVEGFRSLQVQRAMWRHALEAARTRLGETDISILEREAGRYAAPPDAITPPPHTTGGAVDVEIADADGNRLDFFSPYEITDHAHARADAAGLSDEAQQNRAMLKRILEPTGLTQYVDEWWHWSYGDNGWALRTGAQHALYGKIELPADADWVGDLNKMPQ
jgi:D-alanyl-D-alanine dipeptidase